ncbi:sporulation protein Cse60 [Carboxylicivirga taeanensis]|uniref:sporulation protein Cse60 n=1 Tax=Carboxylicivirga taeanensis TaxID=1416875 RepID=UPI003F6DED75
MSKVLTKHFQYTGTDDFDKSLDEQINDFIQKEAITTDDLIDIKFSGHADQGVATYSALLLYKKY